MTQHTDKGSNLIFIISQPRSGSTLLQAIIAKHPAIKTIPEPWLLLPLLSIQRDNAHIADYDAITAQKAIAALIAHLPEQNKTYYEGIRKLVLHLYEGLMTADGSQYFVDKTPRYYFIIPEIRDLFPDALIIVLLRNPLAVLCSMIARNNKGWLMLGGQEADLMTAPYKLNAAQTDDKQTLVLHYEKYLESPDVLQNVFERVNLSPPADLTTYKAQDTLVDKGFGGDKNVEQFTSIQPKNVDKWVEMLNDPQVWRVCQDYLDILGSKLMNELGYDYGDIQKILAEKRPNLLSRVCTIPLKWFFVHKQIKTTKWHPRFLVFFVIRLIFFRSHQPYNVKDKLREWGENEIYD